MKFLIHSNSGGAAGLAHKLAMEGADVMLHIKNKNCKDMLRGICPRTDVFLSSVAKLQKDRDVILFDMVGNGNMADMLKKNGYNVLFSSKFADRLELDRIHGMEVAKKAGMDVPEYHLFRTSSSAKAFLSDNDGKWVIKPNQNKPPSFTSILNGSKQGINHIEWLRKNGLYKEGESFVLQEFIEGTEVSTELWLKDGKPVYPVNGTVEIKKFLAGDLGASTGSETSVVWNYQEKEPRIYGQTLKKLLILFESVKYTGPIDVNCIVSHETMRANFLEFTPRLGYNAIFAFCSLLQMPLSEFLAEMAFGNLDTLPVDKDKFGYALRVSIPPYPLTIEKEEDYVEDALLSSGKLIQMDEDSMENIYLSDVMSDGGDYLTAGADGYIMDIAVKGNSPMDASYKARGIFDNVSLLEKQARTVDGVRRAEKTICFLEMNHFLRRKEHFGPELPGNPVAAVNG